MRLSPNTTNSGEHSSKSGPPRQNPRPSHALPRSDSAIAAPDHAAEALNAAAAADRASAAVHNIAAAVDRERTRRAWNLSHQAFVHARCELRRRREQSALNAMARMLPHLDALLAMARQVGRWPQHVAAGERTTERLRAALHGSS